MRLRLHGCERTRGHQSPPIGSLLLLLLLGVEVVVLLPLRCFAWMPETFSQATQGDTCHVPNVLDHVSGTLLGICLGTTE